MNPVWHFVNGIPQIGTLRVTPSQVMVGDGSASAPSYSFASNSGVGLYQPTSGFAAFASGGVYQALFGGGVLKLPAASSIVWGSGSGVGDASDVSLSRRAAGDLGSNSSFSRTDANGQALSILQTLTELTTITAAATTDTTIQMPANSVVLGVSVRVTTVIPTAATFTVGDSGSAARFSTAAVSTAANSTDPGTKAGAYYNASALSIRITPNLTPAANTGRVRVTIYYYTVTPPTS